jgi:hypothetical protein
MCSRSCVRAVATSDLPGFVASFCISEVPTTCWSEVPDIAVQREALIQEAWRWILSTEPLKAFLMDSPAYMRDLLKHLERQRLKFPLLSDLLPREETR